MSATYAINRSSAKQRYSFPKNERFKVPKPYTDVGSYDFTSKFDVPVDSGIGKPFGAAVERFNYMAKPNAKPHKVKSPSPDKYEIKGQFGSEVQNSATNVEGQKLEFSFGVSRTSMQKIHIDQINAELQNGSLSPGPGQYSPAKPFGRDGH